MIEYMQRRNLCLKCVDQHGYKVCILVSGHIWILSLFKGKIFSESFIIKLSFVSSVYTSTPSSFNIWLCINITTSIGTSSCTPKKCQQLSSLRHTHYYLRFEGFISKQSHKWEFMEQDLKTKDSPALHPQVEIVIFPWFFN